MFRNYLKTTIRNLWRNKTFSFINIAGLAIGIATCLVIMLFVQNELGYDRFNEKAEQIVRVIFQGSVQGQKMKEASVMPPVAKTLKADYPEVLDATRLRSYGTQRIIYGDKSFKDDAFAYVDPNFFNVFTLPFLHGDSKTALSQPNAIVISQAVAEKYFGNENPVGQVLNFKSLNTGYKITGVIKNVPVNSHFHFDIFGSMASLPEANEPTWMTSNFHTYLLLPKGYDYKQLEAKLPQAINKYLSPQLQKSMGMTIEQFREKGNDLGLLLQPLTDIHLKSDLLYDLSPAGDIRYVYIFGAIALFMLIIACINFMNLSTAGASKRAKEVGIRKVLGSMKRQLVWQFIIESIVLTFIAMLLALVFVKSALPLFNDLSGKDLTFNLIENPQLLFVLLVFGLIVGAFAGSYPAFFLSSFNPIAVLKTRFTPGKGTIGLRSGLVVFQFFISITLMVCTAVVYQQLSYIHNKELGYNKDQVLLIGETYLLGKNEEVLRQQLQQDSRVVNVSTSGYLPAGPTNSNNFFVYPENNESQLVKALRYDVDYNYIPTLGMKVVAGRNFSKEFRTDSAAAILNETAAKALGWKNDAIGHTITRSNNEGGNTTYKIIGIVKDFHFKSLHEPISPLVMALGNNSGTIIARVKTKDISSLLSTLKKQWASFNTEEPFVYAFLDERFKQTYEKEQKTGIILGIFACLTIFVACLGLFGLATFMAEQRTKEIGIRKVLGASVAGVVSLLTRDFLKLVFIAFIVAAPVAAYIMHKWLQDFAYRVNVQWWIFVFAAITAVLITVFSVGFKAIKAAIANPVKSLRTE
ncbi:MAG: FtsX-like permease family protein [Segetibacter sp.]|nr:FtsX-like permease family protein [Segetibacter sp.]